MNKLAMENEMKENVVMDRSYAFALEIIQLYKHLISEEKEYVISKQLLRSGTAIGALIKEAEHGQSKNDFLSKMNIALKEANETEYWLMLLCDSGYIEKKIFDDMKAKIVEILKLLISIVKRTKNNLGK